ncbi:uncharacterized protein LOC134243442 [Saccostrea cucullata]|uniref:uncharacterized protein LOC134243442 n=1 Tax=Saccostrea cuccullata TaxID=36930 RepID=UPI002ED1D8B3
MPRLHQRRMSIETDKVSVNVHRLKHRRMSVETEKVEIDVKHLHPRRKSVEAEKVENDLHRLKHRRMSVETESPSLLGYLHRRRWSWDTIHHISDTLHLTLKGKRRSTLPEEGIECEGEETHHGRFHHFTRSVSMTLRKKKTPVPALAIVEFENGNVKLVRELLNHLTFFFYF